MSDSDVAYTSAQMGMYGWFLSMKIEITQYKYLEIFL